MLVAVYLVPAISSACTVCAEGPAGAGFNPTRAAIYNSDFFQNFLIAAAPFAVLAILLGIIHYACPENGAGKVVHR